MPSTCGQNDGDVVMTNGNVIFVRFADDNVVGFEKLVDATRFLADLRKRLKKFGLTLHPDKTRLIEFGRFAARNRAQRGFVGKSQKVECLRLSHEMHSFVDDWSARSDKQNILAPLESTIDPAGEWARAFAASAQL
jgi:hypothetical protein